MKDLHKKKSFWFVVALAVVAFVTIFLVIGFDDPTPTANASTPTTSATTTAPLPEDCKQLEGTFAVPKQHCTSEDVTPRPLDEISPNGDSGSCWPARQFDSPAKASNWLAANAAGKLRAEQFSTFASGHRDYNGYIGANGTDYAKYVNGLIREPLTYPVRVLNHYCDANGVKQWKAQVLPVGKVVYFRPGYAPSQTTPDKIRPVKLEACGNDTLPPPPPPPPVCPPGSDMAGQPIPTDGCNNPPTTTVTTTRPPGTTTTTRTTTPCPPGNDTPSCRPKRKEDGPVHSGDIPSQAQGTNPPVTRPAEPPTAGQPQPTRTNPPAPVPTTPRPAPTQTTQPPPPSPTVTRTYAPTCAPNDPNPACG